MHKDHSFPVTCSSVLLHVSTQQYKEKRLKSRTSQSWKQFDKIYLTYQEPQPQKCPLDLCTSSKSVFHIYKYTVFTLVYRHKNLKVWDELILNWIAPRRDEKDSLLCLSCFTSDHCYTIMYIKSNLSLTYNRELCGKPDHSGRTV